MADKNGHWVACVLNIDNTLIILVNVYGYNNDQENKNLLHQISTVIKELYTKFPTDYIVVGGDFNVTPDEWLDRWPSKFSREHKNPIFEKFANDTKLIDVWRVLNEDVKQFTWHKPNGQSRSRIDYWLVSNSILQYVKETVISNSPLSDHCAIILRLQSKDQNNTFKDYWKFNCQMLRNEEYCNSIKKLILDIQNDEAINTPILKWEYLKFRIRKTSIAFGKKLNRQRKEEESNVVKELMNLYGKLNWTEEEKGKINNLQSKLDKMYLYRAKAAYLRSKAKWIEEGEKNTAYFCNLEKRRQEYNSICNLIIDGEECTDPKRISNEVFTFYSNLYKSSYSEQNVTSFFDKISNWIPVIDDNFREICDEDLTIEEFDFAIKSNIAHRDQMV